MRRRTFIGIAGAGVAGSLRAAGASVAVVVDPIDQVANATPAKWAVGELLGRLKAGKVEGRILTSVGLAAPGEVCVVASGPLLTPPLVMPAASRPAVAAEAFTLSNTTVSGRRVLLAAGHDARGLMYALLELADRVTYGDDPLGGLRIAQSIREQPANRVRSVMRAFVNEVEDKPWFYDRGGWRDYLTLLATHRFNRFQLGFGLGYDSVSEVRDSYFQFAYPFFINLPGYKVPVTRARLDAKPELLTDDERARNLGLLQFISDAAAERGLDFQLGLWMQAWNYDAAPNASHRIAGLTAGNQAAYCRDALQALLVACPSISGVTLRMQGESGAFWKTVFSGVAAVGRPVEIDLDGRGLDVGMIGPANSVSPAFSAEHMGLPYPNSYGDLLREDRKYKVIHRIWPGTQRLLLWGDPLMAAGFGRAGSFSGSDGVEWMEPLSFKGREGSGLPGGRNGYAGVQPLGERDWEKFLYTYRVWGRAMYNPAEGADARKRYLRRTLGVAADSCEAALALSSRILPTVTSAHLPSGASTQYWPEIYTNQSIVTERFGAVSALDSRLFCTIDECAADLLEGKRRAAYSPLEVAGWLEELARDSENNLAAAKVAVGTTFNSEYSRWTADIAIQNQLGIFFAAKFRAGVLFAIHARAEAITAYRRARAAWKAITDISFSVYRPDLTFGFAPQLRGTWHDRLAAIDADIAAMEAAPANPAAVTTALDAPPRVTVSVQHAPVKKFRAGVPVVIEASLPGDMPGKIDLCYRRLNQNEKWVVAEMEPAGSGFRSVIPAAYALAAYPLQYYFEVRLETGDVALYPGLSRDYSAAPYYVIRRG